MGRILAGLGGRGKSGRELGSWCRLLCIRLVFVSPYNGTLGRPSLLRCVEEFGAVVCFRSHSAHRAHGIHTASLGLGRLRITRLSRVSFAGGASVHQRFRCGRALAHRRTTFTGEVVLNCAYPTCLSYGVAGLSPWLKPSQPRRRSWRR